MLIKKSYLIKGSRWAVKRIKDLKNDSAEPCNGLIDSEKKLIMLDQSLTGRQLVWCFWHEYGHALFDEAGISSNVDGGMPELAEEIACINLADTLTNLTFKEQKRKRK